jgi:hypothetical protein
MIGCLADLWRCHPMKEVDLEMGMNVTKSAAMVAQRLAIFPSVLFMGAGWRERYRREPAHN